MKIYEWILQFKTKDAPYVDWINYAPPYKTEEEALKIYDALRFEVRRMRIVKREITETVIHGE